MPMLRCLAKFCNYIGSAAMGNYTVTINRLKKPGNYRVLNLFIVFLPSRLIQGFKNLFALGSLLHIWMPPYKCIHMRCESCSQLAWVTIKVPRILLTSRNAGVEGPQTREPQAGSMDKPDTSLANGWKSELQLSVPGCFSGWYKIVSTSQDSSFAASNLEKHILGTTKGKTLCAG